MSEKYIIPLDSEGNPSTEIIVRVADNAWIPKDPANSDYQRYLNPEAEHFTPNL
jgi:hypothetical protein